MLVLYRGMAACLRSRWHLPYPMPPKTKPTGMRQDAISHSAFLGPFPFAYPTQTRPETYTKRRHDNHNLLPAQLLRQRSIIPGTAIAITILQRPWLFLFLSVVLLLCFPPLNRSRGHIGVRGGQSRRGAVGMGLRNERFLIIGPRRRRMKDILGLY